MENMIYTQNERLKHLLKWCFELGFEQTISNDDNFPIFRYLHRAGVIDCSIVVMELNELEFEVFYNSAQLTIQDERVWLRNLIRSCVRDL